MPLQRHAYARQVPKDKCPLTIYMDADFPQRLAAVAESQKRSVADSAINIILDRDLPPLQIGSSKDKISYT